MGDIGRDNVPIDAAKHGGPSLLVWLSIYTSLEVSNITHREFPDDHLFHGHEYYDIDKLQHKTLTLSVHQDYARDTKNHMMIPVMNDNPRSNNFGGSIKIFLRKMALGQTCFNGSTQGF